MRVGEIFSLGGHCGHDNHGGHHKSYGGRHYGGGYHYSGHHYGGHHYGGHHYGYGGGYHRGGLLGIRISL